MSLSEEYAQKKKTAEKVLSLIQDGDYVLSAQAMAEPVSLLEKMPLLRQWGRKGITYNSCMPIADLPWYHDPAMGENLDHVSWFFSGPTRKAHAEGLCSFLPAGSTSLVRKTLQRAAAQHRRPVLLASASPMDAHGYFSLSLSALFERDIIDRGALVLLEVSPHFPRTWGDTLLPISQVAAFVETDRKPPISPLPGMGDLDRKIAAHVAELIPDGSTLQLGVGHIPSAVAEALKDRKHLGIHTGLFSDSLMDLVQCGAVDNSRKGFLEGVSLCAFANGTRELYNFLDNNPGVVFRRGTFANEPKIIARNRNMVSLNTGLEIDLTGQCAAESMGFTQFSATGAQTETVQGAQLSPGGKSILALHSVYSARNAQGEKVLKSKIVPYFRPGTIVSTSRNEIDYVVTEYGVAWLRGASVRERVNELIAVAHPAFREKLRAEARRCGIG
ncbi:acetyl-CoA hydrolase/transferase C-terminal domain-containing protein [Acidaminococcus fermentans]|uniref:acetyl-CoA hydrolase/transferase family protein n=1 Tax=Acidaminococcus fermentans TaxID=905 RepID=UPI00242EF68A|nr:acetyl-CoA hydrolase/transferase C-terminal domain-containing protein [Acidaminococcus fermentans]